MKKIYLLVATLLLSLSLSACATKNESTPETIQKETTQVAVENTTEEVNSTMKKIFESGKATTCTFSITQEWQVFDGILYVDGKKMRYDSKWSFGWQNIEMNVIVKDGYSYSWNTMEAGKGYKMIEDEWNDEWWYDESCPEEREQEMKFTCKKWVDWNTFDLPANVVFEEVSIPEGF